MLQNLELFYFINLQRNIGVLHLLGFSWKRDMKYFLGVKR